MLKLEKLFTVVRLVQPENAYPPRLVNAVGSVIVGSDVHL